MKKVGLQRCDISLLTQEHKYRLRDPYAGLLQGRRSPRGRCRQVSRQSVVRLSAVAPAAFIHRKCSFLLEAEST